MKAALACALLAAASASGQVPFDWAVPGQTSWVDVTETPGPRGEAMALASATSRLLPVALWEHYLERFTAAGFYVPPPEAQLQVAGALQLTGLDVEREVSYTVLLRALPARRGTRLLLSATSVGPVRRTSPGAPLVPGASSVLTTRLEGAEVVSYAVAQPPDEVRSFYVQVLPSQGWRATGPGVFALGDRRLEITLQPLSAGRTGVLLRLGLQNVSGSSSTSTAPP
ncbi:MAG: hypothetical protein K1X89_31280 [Myxococcaceae bacterium]|nr:hypothetical protein [Myxococcaceae bacterium]